LDDGEKAAASARAGRCGAHRGKDATPASGPARKSMDEHDKAEMQRIHAPLFA